MQTRVQRWGNSLALRIPRAFAETLGLAENEPVEIDLQDGKLVLSPNKRPSLTDLVAEITDENCHHEIPWGSPQGSEVW